MTVVLWGCLALVAWSYLGYPLVLALWEGLGTALEQARALWSGPERPPARPADAGPLPRVSIVFSAFDEAACIEAKVQNCLALDYPSDRLEILVGCDGCTDGTAALARKAGGDRVTVRECSPRQGKASVLSRLVPSAAGEIVVLTDANVTLEPGAVRALEGAFRDPSVGAAVGRLRLVHPTRRTCEEGLYWKYETLLKHWEGRRGAVIGANGGIYAVRRTLFTPLPADTIVDDLVIPARIAARGFRVPFVPGAVAWEETAPDAAHEFRRRARIGAGNWQAVARLPGLLDPRRGFACFGFVSHKLLRWAAPLLLGAAFLANLSLAARPGAWGDRALLVTQAAFYALAFAGRRPGALRGRAGRAAALAHYFVGMNAALAVGLWRFLRGTQSAAWQRTARRTAEA